MRVVLGLLLLAGLASAAIDTINPDADNVFHITGGTIGAGGAPNSGYIFTGTPNGNPTLNMTIGTTYYISIEFDSAGVNHPFGLSTASTGTTVTDNGLTVNATSGPCGTAGPAHSWTFGSTTGPFCVLKFVAPNTTTPLYYHCAVHSSMVGSLQLNAPAAPATNETNNGTNPGTPTTPVPTNNGTNTTTPPPTTNGTTTPPPTTNGTTTPPPTTPAAGSPLNADNTNTFHVASANGTNEWIFTSGGVQYPNPTLNMAYGQTYKISIEFNTQIHPFGLSKSGSGTIAVSDLGLVNANGTTTCGGSATTGYTSTTTCLLTFTPPANTPQPLYYHCAFHPNMFGQIVVSGLPKSSGFALVPGFAAFFAIIAALFAQ